MTVDIVFFAVKKMYIYDIFPTKFIDLPTFSINKKDYDNINI